MFTHTQYIYIIILSKQAKGVLASLRMVIESQLPNGKMVSLGVPVSDCYYTGTMMDGSGTVAISQCNNDMV